MRQQLWRSLVMALQHGQCILVLGPELPATTGGGDGLTGQLTAELEELGRHVAAGQSPAGIAQLYEDAVEFGPDALRATAAGYYRDLKAAPQAAHEALASLPFRIVLSIGHDKLIVRALREQGKQPRLHHYNMRGDKLRNPEIDTDGTVAAPIVYQLFGDPDEPASLVLSENDLLDFLIKMIGDNPPLPRSLVRALRAPTMSFLFVGFGLKQWYLRVLLKVLLRRHELSRPGNAVAAESLTGLPDTEKTQTILFFQRGTRVELEDADAGPFLAEVRQKLEQQGGYAGESAPPGGRPPRVFISYASEDRPMARRVHDGLRARGMDPWMDEGTLRGGTDWNERIEEELDATDFAVVLYSQALGRKLDSYVNKEIALAEDRAMRIRGDFLIPVAIEDVPMELRVPALEKKHNMRLRPDSFDADLAEIGRTISREFQRRNR